MSDKNEKILQLVVESSIRLLVLGLLFYFCLQIANPFVGVVMWAIIIAVAVYPLYLKFLPIFSGRRGTTATTLVLLTLVIFIVPVLNITASVVQSAQDFSSHLESGTLEIPPPGDKVKGWPLIGEQLHAAWSLASENLGEAAKKYNNEIKSMSQSLIGMLGGFGSALFVFIFSTIFAGMMLANGEQGHEFTLKVFNRLAGPRGHDLTDLSVKTVRSVAQGVIGIAVIQAILAAIGLLLIGVPGAAIWSLLILVMAIAQLPSLIVLGPIIIWVFSVNDTMPAVIFMIYSLLVGISDTFLKPLLLGRGMDIPMPVILVGAIGGMIYAGIIGLFVGAIVLALGYSLFMRWLDMTDPDAAIDE
jgi:predicted PurR-regulated permease PerM